MPGLRLSQERQLGQVSRAAPRLDVPFEQMPIPQGFCYRKERRA